MRIAVLSDVHSNLEALDAVLSLASDAGAGATFVLGDIVGYGADPEAVVSRLGELPGALLIAGNHDLAATGRFDLTWFNGIAAEAIRWTASTLSPDARAMLMGLEPRGESSEALLVHGSVVDPAAEYVLDPSDAAKSFGADGFELCFFGHTHLPAVFVEAAGGVSGRALADGEVVGTNGGRRFMLNPGSVGQPRDGDPRASFLMYDTEVREARVIRVPYPLDRAQGKIRRAGLPEFLAERLARGQ